MNLVVVLGVFALAVSAGMALAGPSGNLKQFARSILAFRLLPNGQRLTLVWVASHQLRTVEFQRSPGWSASAVLVGSGVQNMDATADGAGQQVLVYLAHDTLFAMQRASGAAWSPPSELSPQGACSGSITVSVASYKSFAVANCEADTQDLVFFLGSDGSWSELPPDQSQSHQFFASSAGLISTWYQQGAFYGSRLDATGTWTRPQKILASARGLANEGVVDASGVGAVLGWAFSASGKGRLLLAVVDKAGSWHTHLLRGATVLQDSGATPYPYVAGNGRGRITALWACGKFTGFYTDQHGTACTATWAGAGFTDHKLAPLAFPHEPTPRPLRLVSSGRGDVLALIANGDGLYTASQGPSGSWTKLRLALPAADGLWDTSDSGEALASSDQQGNIWLVDPARGQLSLKSKTDYPGVYVMHWSRPDGVSKPVRFIAKPGKVNVLPYVYVAPGGPVVLGDGNGRSYVHHASTSGKWTVIAAPVRGPSAVGAPVPGGGVLVCGSPGLTCLFHPDGA